jgi:DnaA family protein
MKQLILDISRPPEPTLDNFVVGQNAELLAQLRESLGANPRERFIYAWGGEGAGRTHLLKAFVATGGCYLSNDKHAVLEGELPDCSMVAVDDVQHLNDAAQIGLFNLYNRMREEGGVLLTAGDCAPAQLKLRPDVVTRLGWGLVYQVHALSDEEKAEALHIHATQRGFTLADEVTAYLLRHGRRDLPSLLATLDALDRYSLETKRAITVPMVRELMQGSLDLE